MKRTLLAMLAAVALSASAFAQSDQQPPAPPSDQKPTHAELAQRWAEAALDTQLKGMKASLGLTADQEKDWDPFEAAVRDAAKARVLALQKEQSSGLSPMDRNLAKADRIGQGRQVLQRSSKRPSLCTRASIMRTNRNSSRLDERSCPNAGSL